jgi:hypothetical protein
MMITILSELYYNNKDDWQYDFDNGSALYTAMLMSATLGYSYNATNASSFTKRGSTYCEGDVCHSLICINEKEWQWQIFGRV